MRCNYFFIELLINLIEQTENRSLSLPNLFYSGIHLTIAIDDNVTR